MRPETGEVPELAAVHGPIDGITDVAIVLVARHLRQLKRVLIRQAGRDIYIPATIKNKILNSIKIFIS